MTEDPNPKSGFTVSDLQGTVKKFGLEIAICAIFILSGIFVLVWGGGMLVWSIIVLSILGVIGALLSGPMHKFLHKSLDFCQKDKITGIIIAVVAIVLSVVFPPIIYAIIGLYAGQAMMCDGKGMCHHEFHPEHHEEHPDHNDSNTPQ